MMEMPYSLTREKAAAISLEEELTAYSFQVTNCSLVLVLSPFCSSSDCLRICETLMAHSFSCSRFQSSSYISDVTASVLVQSLLAIMAG
jgi:hypothetical protein